MKLTNWYCVHVAAGCEKKARADLLARREVLGDRFITAVEVPEETYMSVTKSKRVARKRKLLPGYIIVQVEKEKVEYEDGTMEMVFPAFTQETINDTYNVIAFANMNKKKPLPMRAKEVKNLFDRVDGSHTEVKQNQTTDYQEGDILDVVSGPFTGYKCEVIGLQGGKILGQLDMFGRQVPAEFTSEQVYKKG